MHRGGLLACLLALPLALLGVPEVQADARSREAPACRGADLLPAIKQQDAEAARRIEAAAAGTPGGEAMLWRIGVPGRADSYLLGTVHLSDERVLALSPKVDAALTGARTLAVEIADISPESFAAALGKVGRVLVYDDGRSLASQLEPGELETAREGLIGAGFPAEAVGQLRPWFVTMLFAVSACERQRLGAGHLPLDLALVARAREKGTPVVGLETLESQLLAMASLPDAHQLAMLKAAIKGYPQAGDMMETMLQRYLLREMGKVMPMQVEMMRAAGQDPAAFDSFRHAMLSLRNPRMRDKAMPLVQAGGAFIAVGALHLVGEDGLVRLFRDAGLEVTPVE